MDLIRCIEFVNKGTGAFEITNGADRYTGQYVHRSGSKDARVPAHWVVKLDGQDGEETMAQPKADVVAILEQRLTSPGARQVTEDKAVAIVAADLDVLCRPDFHGILTGMAEDACGIGAGSMRMSKMRIVALNPDTDMFHVRVELRRP